MIIVENIEKAVNTLEVIMNLLKPYNIKALKMIQGLSHKKSMTCIVVQDFERFLGFL